MQWRLPTIAALLLVPALASPALADATEPVGRVMALATAFWSDNPPDGADYFGEEQLASDYSAGFVADYRAAAKNPPFGLEEGQTSGSPFDYDPITNGQDGCPLEDIVTKTEGEKDGVTTVVVTFKPYNCFDLEAGQDGTRVNRFLVVTENGRPVIDDIVRVLDGEDYSLRSEMKEIATTDYSGGEDGAVEE